MFLLRVFHALPGEGGGRWGMTEVGGSMPVEVEIVVGCVEPRLGRGAMAQRVG
jgi:hypothetical protein